MPTTRTRVARLALLSTVLALTVVTVPAPRPPAATAAGPASVTLEGRGYGHGHGLSQYGAQGAASNHGRTYRQILAFYYPKLALGRAGGRMRVHITGDTSDDVVVRHRSGLRIRSVSSGRSWALTRAGAQRWRITDANRGRTSRIAVSNGGRWRTVRTFAGEAEFTAGGRPIALVKPGGSTSYRGVLRSAGGRDRRTVNLVPLEHYLRGVVPQEVPALWHPQAVRAQAVAARTYAAFERASRGEICDTTSCQVYGGASAEHPAASQAIAATRGQVLLSSGKPAFAQFSASSGGWTAQGSQPYLPAKADPWDRWPGNPHRSWRVSVRATAIERAYPGIGDFQRLQVIRRDGNGTWNGRVLELRIVGSNGTATPSGDSFRSIFGLRSTWFRLT